MNNRLKIVCRGSAASLWQAEQASARLREMDPSFETEIVQLQSNDKAILTGAPDEGPRLFVHSLTDITEEYFSNPAAFAVIGKEDIRDIVIFKRDITEKIRRAETVRVSTAFPEKAFMASEFLAKAIPRYGAAKPDIHILTIEASPEECFFQFDKSSEDGIIISLALLSALLGSRSAGPAAGQILRATKWMILPLFECTPALGQGYIVASGIDPNGRAAELLKKLNDQKLSESLARQYEFLKEYGVSPKTPQKIADTGLNAETRDTRNGFSEKESDTDPDKGQELLNKQGEQAWCGIFEMELPDIQFIYLAGRAESGEKFSGWNFGINAEVKVSEIFSGTDYMKSFFGYRNIDEAFDLDTCEAVFVASHKAVHSAELVEKLGTKKIWAAGSRTWYELAQMGLWLCGCADALGLGNALRVMEGPVPGLRKSGICVLTNKSSTLHWIRDGYNALGTYELIPSLSSGIEEKIRNAAMVFWTSFQQFELCRSFAKKDLVHACAAGKTAALLKESGLRPLVFPTIKAFEYWRKTITVK
jgi:porphobilinogen deaminase